MEDLLEVMADRRCWRGGGAFANSGQNAMPGRFAFLGRAFSKIFRLKIDELKATISVDRSGVFLFGAA